MAPRIPNFFIVGAPKAGTTALYEFLGRHPSIYLAPLKEPNYFADELRPENFAPGEQRRIDRQMHELQHYLRGNLKERRFGALVRDWNDYLKLFAHAGNQAAVGEASACYLWSPSAPFNIAGRIPHARIIINLRNPIERAYSQYLQMVSAGLIGRTFRDQLLANVTDTRRLFGPDWPMLEFGRYHEQITRYLQVFERSSLHISLYEDLLDNPRLLLAQLCDFLGVAPFDVDPSQRYHQPSVPRLSSTAYLLKRWGLWPYLRRLLPIPLGPRLRILFMRSRKELDMDEESRAWLTDFYRDEVNKLGELLNRDLSGWLQPPRREAVSES